MVARKRKRKRDHSRNSPSPACASGAGVRTIRVKSLARVFSAVLLAALACSAPGADEPGPSERATAAALTVQAVLTQLAPSQTPAPPTPLPSPTPALSPTLPQETPTASPPPASPLPACAGEDGSEFVADVTVPDGTSFAPDTAFTKTWRIRNSGECTWEAGYVLLHVEGPIMGALESVPLPSTVPAGQEADISVEFTSPATSGAFRSTWQMQRPDGQNFGVRVYVEIVVP